jgi:hypothetical protein
LDGNQPDARPVRTHRITQILRTINAHNADIHALSGIRTYEPSVRVTEDSSCLRPHGHCDWRFEMYPLLKREIVKIAILISFLT